MRWAILLAACGGAQPALRVEPMQGPPGSLGKACGTVPYYVSSGNDGGECHAVVDDQTGALVAMGCDDGKGNRASLACSKAGQVSCKAAGSGLCATSEHAVRPATDKPATAGYFANRCGLATYVVAPGNDRGTCVGTFDPVTGTRSMHCDDGAGDTADFTCRDGAGACTFTGTGVCSTDETLVRKP